MKVREMVQIESKRQHLQEANVIDRKQVAKSSISGEFLQQASAVVEVADLFDKDYRKALINWWHCKQKEVQFTHGSSMLRTTNNKEHSVFPPVVLCSQTRHHPLA